MNLEPWAEKIKTELRISFFIFQISLFEVLFLSYYSFCFLIFQWLCIIHRKFVLPGAKICYSKFVFIFGFMTRFNNRNLDVKRSYFLKSFFAFFFLFYEHIHSLKFFAFCSQLKVFFSVSWFTKIKNHQFFFLILFVVLIILS